MRRILTVIGLGTVIGAASFLSGSSAPVAAEGAGTIAVEVKYHGAPVVERVKVNKDTHKCGTEAVIERVKVGDDKGLANAVVSVPVATGQKLAKAVLDQKGCAFVPRVVLMSPGEIDVKNSDDILHNIHTYSAANPSINKAQPKFKKVMTEKFEAPEIVKVTCDVHSWMLGWIAVTSGAAALTDDTGTVKIDNVPAGKQKVAVWHETLGTLHQEVDVKAGQTTKISFEMKGK